MSIFSLNWFKSRKQKELEALMVEEQILKNDILRKEKDLYPEEVKNPFASLKMVNDVLTVVLLDGSILSKSGATKDDFSRARSARTEAELINICSDRAVREEREKQDREIARIKAIQDSIKNLGKLSDFLVEGNTVYMKGTGRSMPQLLVEKFAEILNKYKNAPVDTLDYCVENDEEYQSHKRFFMWCCLNPRAEVADKLYNFLKKNSFRITKQGFFTALRNVVTLHGSPELVHFVSNTYNKVKAVWKKDPEDYYVFLKDNVYSFVHHSDMYEEIEDYDDETGESFTDTIYRYDLGEEIGNLKELYLDLPNRNENRFTDAHTKTFDIRVGRPVSMDPGACRWNTDDCGAEGLHFTANEIHYVGCGDQSVLVLINPMKVVGIGESKGRCWEYLPIMTVSREEATQILHDVSFDTLQLDEDYAIRELENLSEKAKDGFSKEMKKHSFDIPHMTSMHIDITVASLEKMRQTLSKRVSSID